MPNDPTWEETTEPTPTWDETVEPNQEPASMALSRLPTGPTARAGMIRYKPQPLGPESVFGGADIPSGPSSESLLGISPSLVPAGTGPLTSTLSAVGKTAAGLGQFATSPKGLMEIGAAETPAAPIVFTKWAYDLLKGGYDSTKDAVNHVGQLIRSSVANGMISQNQLGEPKDTTQQEHIQAIAEDAVNAAASLLGAAGVVHGGIESLRPAVKIDGRVISGAPGETHADILKDKGKDPESTPHESTDRGFTVKGAPDVLIPRKESEKVAGVEGTADAGGLDSKDLPKTVPSSTVGEPPPTTPAAVGAPEGGGQASPTESATTKPTVTSPVTQDQVVTPSGPEMGAAGLGEVEPTGTGLKNAIGDMERVGLGLHDAPETVQRNMAKAWEKSGQVEAATPGAGAALAKHLIEDPEMGLTDDQSAMLLRHKVDLFNKLNAAAEKTHTAEGTAKETAQKEYNSLLVDYGQLLDAVKKRGSEWGREGRWRQAMAMEDFTFSSVDDMNRFSKTIRGEDLPGSKVTRAEKIAKVVKRGQKEADEANGKVLADITEKTKSLPKSPSMSEAEKRAFDASMKTVREWAIARADKETADRVEKAKTSQEVYEIQRDAAERAMNAAAKTVRNAAKDLADAESKRRTATAKADREAAKVQAKAERKALDAADKLHRDNAIALAKAQRALRDDPIKAVWSKVKDLIDRQEGDFDRIRGKVAVDLGMKPNSVARIMAQDPRTKFLMNDAWIKQQKAEQLRQQAKRWVAGADTPELVKWGTSVPRLMFGLKTAGHGTVPLGTHAPFVAFQPQFWSSYFPAYKTMYRMVLNKAFYQEQVRDLQMRPNYVEARRAGLVNDPTVYEDYTSPEIAKYVTGGQVGVRGFTVLKILRQDMFDQMWNKLRKSEQTPDMAKAIADAVNHDTGVIKAMAPKSLSVALFAPRLEASRVASLVVDPVKALGIFTKQLWTRATPAERQFAVHQLTSKASIAATMFGLLEANQALLSASGSKQKVNFDDPFRSDWLKFKVAGFDYAYGNAMLSMMRMPTSLYRIVSSDGGKTKNLVYADESVSTILFRYGRTQVSPFTGTLLDQAFGSDYASRPLPRKLFGLMEQDRPVPKRLAAEGLGQYTYPEYWSEQLSPIPFQEAMKSVWEHGFGIKGEEAKGLEKAIAISTVMGLTGGRLTEDREAQ